MRNYCGVKLLSHYLELFTGHLFPKNTGNIFPPPRKGYILVLHMKETPRRRITVTSSLMKYPRISWEIGRGDYSTCPHRFLQRFRDRCQQIFLHLEYLLYYIKILFFSRAVFFWMKHAIGMSLGVSIWHSFIVPFCGMPAQKQDESAGVI